MKSLFISAALYLFFRRFFSPTEASVRDNEYLHCIQTHRLKKKQKNNGSCRTNSSPCCADALTAAPGNKKSTRGGWKIPHIHTFHNITDINLELLQCHKSPTFKSLMAHRRRTMSTLTAGRQSRAEGGMYWFLGSSERPVRLFKTHNCTQDHRDVAPSSLSLSVEQRWGARVLSFFRTPREHFWRNPWACCPWSIRCT